MKVFYNKTTNKSPITKIYWNKANSQQCTQQALDSRWYSAIESSKSSRRRLNIQEELWQLDAMV